MYMDKVLTPTQLRIIGKGMSFPEPINKSSGSTKVSEGFDKINQSISVILSTREGTRVGNRAFGSKLHTIIFEPNDHILADLAKLYIDEALKNWEPRINVVDIECSIDPLDSNVMRCTIHYVLKSSNLYNNLVYSLHRKVY